MALQLFLARLTLPAGEEGAALRAACAALLSPDERARAAAFAFPHLRERFTVGRAFLRAVLGRATGRRPDALRLSYGPHGKPDLASPPGPHFNLSHTEDLALLALDDRRELGVDLEHLRPIDDADALVASHFCPGEQAAFAAASAEDRLPLFYRLWTRKEAVLKALGAGLSLPADQVEVSAGLAARLVRLAGDAAAADRWLLLDVPLAPGLAAALAVAAGGDEELALPRVATWQPSELFQYKILPEILL